MTMNKITLKVLCPHTEEYVFPEKCQKCKFYGGWYANNTIECWHGTSTFAMAQKETNWNNENERKQLPAACRPFKAPHCRYCPKLDTDKCDAYIRRMAQLRRR